jgi:RNA polymerase primary sigma factor
MTTMVQAYATRSRHMSAEIQARSRARLARDRDHCPQRGIGQELERDLVQAARDGDLGARDQLVEVFTPLIAGVARVYRNAGAVDRVELMQEGVLGLLRALERYDAGRGTPFWAYASFWVRQAMQQLVAELARPVVLSDRALRQLARVKQARREYLQEYKSDPTSMDLADSTGIAREQVERLTAVERLPRSVDERVGDEGLDTTVGDMLADPTAEDEYERVERRLDTETLRDLSGELGERERVIVRARYGLDGDERTLRELAGTLQLSAERVRQIEERALEKLGAAQLV